MKQIPLNKVFDIEYGNGLSLQDMSAGDTAFIARGSKNNGISSFVSNIKTVKPFDSSKITVAVSGSVLESFYHNYPFYTAYHVMVLTALTELSEKEMLCYCALIRTNKYRYNYGRQANKTLSHILVPPVEEVTKLARNIKIPRKPSSKTFFSNKNINAHLHMLSIDSWEEFNIRDLFSVKGSQTTPLLELKKYGNGKHPYITTQSSDNGTEGFYDFFTEDGNILTVDSAVLGYCSYQPYNFAASDHVEKLIPKFQINQYIAIFLVTVLNMEQYRYSYGRKSSQNRMKKCRIKLPATKDKNPDWQFMENYIKSLPYSSNL